MGPSGRIVPITRGGATFLPFRISKPQVGRTESEAMMEAHRVEITRVVRPQQKIVTDPRQIKTILSAIQAGDPIERFIPSPWAIRDTFHLNDDQGNIIRTVHVIGCNVVCDGRRHYTLDASAYRAIIEPLIG